MQYTIKQSEARLFIFCLCLYLVVQSLNQVISLDSHFVFLTSHQTCLLINFHFSQSMRLQKLTNKTKEKKSNTQINIFFTNTIIFNHIKSNPQYTHHYAWFDWNKSQKFECMKKSSYHSHFWDNRYIIKKNKILNKLNHEKFMTIWGEEKRKQSKCIKKNIFSYPLPTSKVLTFH